MCGNMPCWTKIYAIFGTVTERAFRKKFQNTGTYTNDTTIRSGFVSAKRVRWRSRVLDFFQDSRIRVKYFCRSSWHCIVGKSFGSYVTHQTSHFIYFYLDKFAILLFKSAWASKPNNQTDCTRLYTYYTFTIVHASLPNISEISSKIFHFLQAIWMSHCNSLYTVFRCNNKIKI